MVGWGWVGGVGGSAGHVLQKKTKKKPKKKEPAVPPAWEACCTFPRRGPPDPTAAPRNVNVWPAVLLHPWAPAPTLAALVSFSAPTLAALVSALACPAGGGPDVVVAIHPNHSSRVVLLQQDNRVAVETFEEVVELAVAGCRAVADFMRGRLLEHTQALAAARAAGGGGGAGGGAAIEEGSGDELEAEDY